MKKKQPKKFNESVHYSVKNRKAFKTKMILLFIAVILILLGCAAMFTFGTVTWDPDEGFNPKTDVMYWWQALLVAFGAVIAVGSLVGFFFICKKIFKGFYDTQAVYWKSAEFKKAKANALKVDLYKLKKKDLKWYKKMGYINADKMRSALEEQKIWIKACKADKQKVNYAKSKA